MNTTIIHNPPPKILPIPNSLSIATTNHYFLRYRTTTTTTNTIQPLIQTHTKTPLHPVVGPTSSWRLHVGRGNSSGGGGGRGGGGGGAGQDNKLGKKSKEGGMKDEKWTHQGLITESLPNGMFRVRLDNEDEVIGYVSGKIRQSFIRILPGDRVEIEVSRYDSTRGRIIYRLRNKE